MNSTRGQKQTDAIREMRLKSFAISFQEIMGVSSETAMNLARFWSRVCRPVILDPPLKIFPWHSTDSKTDSARPSDSSD